MPTPVKKRAPGDRLALNKSDLASLRASGLTDATIRDNGLRTETDPAVIADLLNHERPSIAHKGGLIFPYRNERGKVNGFARVRPHRPRTKDGKPIKYEQPKGAPLRAYFPAATVPRLNKAGGRIFITEGEKKALALSQLGLAAVGIGGVDCWGKQGELLDDFARLDWAGREVWIVFDHDEKETTRANVAAAKKRLAKALKQAGASEVYDVVLPPGPNGSKQGIDDFLVAQEAKAKQKLIELIDSAQPVLSEPAKNTVIKIIPVAAPELAEPAYHGLIGEFLRAVAPHTEATDAGLLAHLLPAIGTIIGPGPHVPAGGKQPARVNAVVVGPTNSGRKGTSASIVDNLMERVDSDFWASQRVGGLSSGEGLIAFVADLKSKDEDGACDTTPVEKRLFVVEEEYSRVLANIRREGNVLSQIIRSAFDSGDLATLTVNPRQAHGAHISIVGHITPEELGDRLDHIEMANGFGNRFLWFLVKSEKIMASTRPIPDKVFLPFQARLRSLLVRGGEPKSKAVALTPEAQAHWEQLYPCLREDRPGLAGAMIARGSAFVLRMSLIYAFLDAAQSKWPSIRIEHLRAAEAVWRYCERSAEQLFDSQTGDKLGDKLLQLLSAGPMTKDQFNKHLSAKQKNEVVRALERLEETNLIKRSAVKGSGAGRPATRWERV